MTLREIDTKIEEFVMGYTRNPSNCPVCGFRLATSVRDGCIPGNCSMRPIPKRKASDPAAYSSDFAAAWTIVDHLKRTRKVAFVMGCNGCASQITVWFNDGIWALAKQQNSVPQPNDPNLLGGATAETAPLAICKAALRVAGIDPNTGEKL